MFGMAAVQDIDVEQMKQATQAAKAASNAGGGEGDDDAKKPKLPSPSLPRPGGSSNPSGSTGGSGTLPKPGGLSIPRPNHDGANAAGRDEVNAGIPVDQAKTEAMAPISRSGMSDTAPQPIARPKTAEPAAPELSGTAPAEARGTDDTPASDSPSRTPMWNQETAEQQVAGPSDAAPVSPPSNDGPTGWGDSNDASVSGDDAWSEDSGPADAWGAQPSVSSDNSWGDPSTAPTTPDQPAAGPAAAAGGFRDAGMPQGGPDAPMATSGSGGGFPGGSDGKADNKKMLIYAGAAVAGVLFFCCILSVIYSFFF